MKRKSGRRAKKWSQKQIEPIAQLRSSKKNILWEGEKGERNKTHSRGRFLDTFKCLKTFKIDPFETLVAHHRSIYLGCTLQIVQSSLFHRLAKAAVLNAYARAALVDEAEAKPN